MNWCSRGIEQRSIIKFCSFSNISIQKINSLRYGLYKRMNLLIVPENLTFCVNSVHKNAKLVNQALFYKELKTQAERNIYLKRWKKILCFQSCGGRTVGVFALMLARFCIKDYGCVHSRKNQTWSLCTAQFADKPSSWMLCEPKKFAFFFESSYSRVNSTKSQPLQNQFFLNFIRRWIRNANICCIIRRFDDFQKGKNLKCIFQAFSSHKTDTVECISNFWNRKSISFLFK